MIGVDFADHHTAVAVEQACFRRGLLVLTCGQRAVRLAPPLVVSDAEVATALSILADACASLDEDDERSSAAP
jgi:4-aminobutyrate aminotransferase